jgi:hypothetical protein
MKLKRHDEKRRFHVKMRSIEKVESGDVIEL